MRERIDTTNQDYPTPTDYINDLQVERYVNELIGNDLLEINSDGRTFKLSKEEIISVLKNTWLDYSQELLNFLLYVSINNSLDTIKLHPIYELTSLNNNKYLFSEKLIHLIPIRIKDDECAEITYSFIVLDLLYSKFIYINSSGCEPNADVSNFHSLFSNLQSNFNNVNYHSASQEQGDIIPTSVYLVSWLPSIYQQIISNDDNYSISLYHINPREVHEKAKQEIQYILEDFKNKSLTDNSNNSNTIIDLTNEEFNQDTIKNHINANIVLDITGDDEERLHSYKENHSTEAMINHMENHETIENNILIENNIQNKNNKRTSNKNQHKNNKRSKVNGQKEMPSFLYLEEYKKSALIKSKFLSCPYLINFSDFYNNLNEEVKKKLANSTPTNQDPVKYFNNILDNLKRKNTIKNIHIDNLKLEYTHCTQKPSNYYPVKFMLFMLRQEGDDPFTKLLMKEIKKEIVKVDENFNDSDEDKVTEHEKDIKKTIVEQSFFNEKKRVKSININVSDDQIYYISNPKFKPNSVSIKDEKKYDTQSQNDIEELSKICNYEHIEFQHKSNPPQNDSYYIANIDILKQKGAFAKNDLAHDCFIECYSGERVKNNFEDTSYIFDVSTTKGDQKYIDAKNKGNGARFFNNSQYPNIYVKKITFSGGSHIHFYTNKTIKKDEELFINYGNCYFTHLPDIQEVFLNPNDNWNTPQEKYQLNNSQYAFGSYKFNDDITSKFKLGEHPYILTELLIAMLENNINRFKELLKNHDPNLPILSVDNDNVRTRDQQNLTVLHLACYLIKEEYIDLLLSNDNTNLHPFAHYTGDTPLFALVKSKAANDKIAKLASKLFDEFHKRKSLYFTYDENHCTILHYAIQRNNSELAKSIFKFAKKLEADLFKQIFNEHPRNTHLSFDYCLKNNYLPLLKVLIHAIDTNLFKEKIEDKSIFKDETINNINSETAKEVLKILSESKHIHIKDSSLQMKLEEKSLESNRYKNNK